MDLGRLISGGAYHVSGGRVGRDITPGYSATNVARTQVGRIADPNINAIPWLGNPFNNGQVLGASTTNEPWVQTGDTTAGGQNPNNSGNYNESNGNDGGMSDAQERAMALFNIQGGITSADDGLSRLDNQLQSGYGNIDREYQDAYGRLQGQQQIGERNYNQNRNSTLSEYESNRNNVAQSARSWLDAARRTLGTQGAGGGSAARYGVVNDAQQQAAVGNANAQQTAVKNITALDQGWEDDRNEFINSFADLDSQRVKGRNEYAGTIEGERARLLGERAQLAGKQKIANGGDYKAALAEAAPYTSKISAILDNIDRLTATPAIKERAVTLDRPNLSQYNWARPEQAPVAQQDATLSNPNLAALFGLQPDDRQRQLI